MSAERKRIAIRPVDYSLLENLAEIEHEDMTEILHKALFRYAASPAAVRAQFNRPQVERVAALEKKIQAVLEENRDRR